MLHIRTLGTLSVLVGIIALVIPLTMALAQDDDPESVARAFLAATNADDVDAIEAMFADDVVLNFPGPPGEPTQVFEGVVAARQSLLEDTGNNLHLELLGDPQVNGNTVTFDVLFSDAFTNWAGIPGFKFSGELVVVSGKITSFTAAPDFSQFEAFDPIFGARFEQAIATNFQASATVLIRDIDPTDYSSNLSGMAVLTVIGADFPPLGEFEGWFVSDDGIRKVSAGLLEIGADGTVDHTFTIPTGPRSITIPLEEQNNSGQSGSATLTNIRGRTDVVVNVTPSAQSTGSDPQPIHIHFGRCGVDLGGVDYGLTSVVNGQSATLVKAGLAMLMDGDHAINVHKSGAEAGIYTSCGNIPAADSPTGENLFGAFDKFVITIEPVPDQDPGPSESIIFQGQLPAGALGDIRSLSFSHDGNPSYAAGFHEGEPKGSAVGLREQTWVAFVHAGLSSDSNTMPGIRRHAEHVVNAIEGTGDRGGVNYGDLDNNGTAEDFGDGMGFLNYAADTKVLAQSAMEASPDDATVQAQGQAAIAAAERVVLWATQARDLALLAAASNSLTSATLYAGNTQAAMEKAWEASKDSYRAAQDMGSYTLVFVPPSGPAVGPPPGSPPAGPPPTGDPLVPNVALGALLAGVVLLAGGAYIWHRARRAAVGT